MHARGLRLGLLKYRLIVALAMACRTIGPAINSSAAQLKDTCHSDRRRAAPFQKVDWQSIAWPREGVEGRATKWKGRGGSLAAYEGGCELCLAVGRRDDPGKRNRVFAI